MNGKTLKSKNVDQLRIALVDIDNALTNYIHIDDEENIEHYKYLVDEAANIETELNNRGYAINIALRKGETRHLHIR